MPPSRSPTSKTSVVVSVHDITTPTVHTTGVKQPRITRRSPAWARSIAASGGLTASYRRTSPRPPMRAAGRCPETRATPGPAVLGASRRPPWRCNSPHLRPPARPQPGRRRRGAPGHRLWVVPDRQSMVLNLPGNKMREIGSDNTCTHGPPHHSRVTG